MNKKGIIQYFVIGIILILVFVGLVLKTPNLLPLSIIDQPSCETNEDCIDFFSSRNVENLEGNEYLIKCISNLCEVQGGGLETPFEEVLK